MEVIKVSPIREPVMHSIKAYRSHGGYSGLPGQKASPTLPQGLKVPWRLFWSPVQEVSPPLPQGLQVTRRLFWSPRSGSQSHTPSSPRGHREVFLISLFGLEKFSPFFFDSSWGKKVDVCITCTSVFHITNFIFFNNYIFLPSRDSTTQLYRAREKKYNWNPTSLYGAGQ